MVLAAQPGEVYDYKYRLGAGTLLGHREAVHMDVTDILIENLREALRQVQRSLVLGVVTSLSLMLLQVSTAPAQPIQVPGPVVPVDPSTAKLILGAVYVVAGFMAYASIELATSTARAIKNDQLRDAALSFPSFTTSSDPGIRNLTCLAPPFFFMIAVVVWAVTQWGEEDLVQEVIMVVMLGVLPYVTLFYRTKQLIALRVTEVSDDRATKVSYDLTGDQAQLLSKENYDKIQDGMTPEQVRKIIGIPGPTTVEKLMPDEVYELVWKSGGKEIAVRFKGKSSIGKSSENIVK
jgi:hypothetical protein